MNLTEIKKNQSVVITELKGSAELTLRLSELGFTSGESVTVVGKSLFQSPLYIEIRGAVMALRKNEAECIWVKA